MLFKPSLILAVKKYLSSKFRDGIWRPGKWEECEDTSICKNMNQATRWVR